MALSVNPQDLKELNETFRKLKGFPEVIDEELENFAIDSVEEAQAIAPVDTGNLRRNIRFSPIAQGVEIRSDAPYSEYVEFGTVRQREQPFFFNTIRRNLEETIKRLENRFDKI